MTEQTEELVELTEFQKGARAMFDNILCRTANRYSGRKDLNARIQAENALIEEAAMYAFEEISPEDYNTWVSLSTAHNEAYRLGLFYGADEEKLKHPSPGFFSYLIAAFKSLM